MQNALFAVNCPVAEALCMGVVFHEQDTWHSRERDKGSSQGSNCERHDLHYVDLQWIHCKCFPFCT